MGGEGHHLLQAAAKEVRHQQEDTDGGDLGLQVLIPGRGINKSVVRAQTRGGGGSNYEFSSSGE